MFETVVPEQFTRRSRKAFYEALPLSVAIHVLLVGAAIVGQVWTVVFPEQAPAQAMSFSVADMPPPPPPPPPPPRPKATLPAARVVPIPDEILAPTVIPDEIPIMRPASVVSLAPEAVPDGVEGGVPGGEIGGVMGGVEGGEVGGVIGGTLGGVGFAETNRVTIERDRPLPMFPISQVYPRYPEEARIRAWEDELVVRYVVGKNGRVTNVTVISPPERALFIDATVRAIRSWRFRPLIEQGERKEVQHELTVYYRLNFKG